MQMNDSQRIPASKEAVWAALNDPEILKQCIPGCQSLDMSSPTEMTATSHNSVTADRFHREETRGRILCFIWTSCWRSCGGSCGSGAQGLVGQTDWRSLATVASLA